MAALRPILIAGPTASGKSALALALAEVLGGLIINADALQVYDHWQILTARPDASETARVPHALYGHVPATLAYSVGAWLRELAPILDEARQDGLRPIIIGGTGLYFSALTKGLAEIPAIDPDVRSRGNALRKAASLSVMSDALAKNDPASWAGIDQKNPARVQRAWEVLESTGTGLAAWQSRTGPPLLAEADCVPICLHADRDWLAERINRRFDAMVAQGAIEEVRAWRDKGLKTSLPAFRALGAEELMEHLAGTRTLEDARTKAKIATHQFAKRQRTWFRNRMKSWAHIDLQTGNTIEAALKLVQAPIDQTR